MLHHSVHAKMRKKHQPSPMANASYCCLPLSSTSTSTTVMTMMGVSSLNKSVKSRSLRPSRAPTAKATERARPATRGISSAAALAFVSDSVFVSEMRAPKMPMPTNRRTGRSNVGVVFDALETTRSPWSTSSAPPDSSGSTACTMSAGSGMSPATRRHSANMVA